MWDFATTNPGYAFLMLFLFVMLVRSIFRLSIRAVCIWKHGWPVYPIDADGDVVRASDDDDDDEEEEEESPPRQILRH